jgi:RHS repeat-associated protein
VDKSDGHADMAHRRSMSDPAQVCWWSLHADLRTTPTKAGQSNDPVPPKAHVNIVIFDKNYNFIDVAYTRISDVARQVDASRDVDHEYLMAEYTVKQAGFVFMYVSNNSPVNVCFDNVTITHTPTNVIQYNEYYPFGLQTSHSWTRENSANRYLYNGGNELNENSGWYETFFRGYDAALGRFMQVDPLASLFSSSSPYNFANNNPVLFNDVMGDSVDHVGPGSGHHWSDQYQSMSAETFLNSSKYDVWGHMAQWSSALLWELG